MGFEDAVIKGIPLILVVIGLVEWTKRLGLSGIALQVTSLAMGIVFGVLYQASASTMAGWQDWFGAVVYGIGIGLVASGIYDAVKSATSG